MAISSNYDAKRCVDMWLNMPDLEPDPRSKHSGRRQHTCPVVNCGRVFDNADLLLGHMKRFDHSPCDPTIHLKGSPPELFACVACGLHFKSEEAWRVHVQSKISSSDAEGHLITQTCQTIVCFACPACYLLFNSTDECLQHMSAQKHFNDSLTLNESEERAPPPVPMPLYAKNQMIALCKDVPYSVRCKICRKAITSHQAAQAHFNVSCHQGSAVAVAEKTVAQIMEQLRVRGQCSLCGETFLTQDGIERHDESMQHKAEVNQMTADRAILQYSSFSENLQARREKQRQSLALAWFCDCGQQFPDEAAARKHLLGLNRILHQCGVCDKRVGDAAVAHLHMSRSHGGAHLHNYSYHCCLCAEDLSRHRDVLRHVAEAHSSSGHTRITEREVQPEIGVPD